jgi:hypothetical protein
MQSEHNLRASLNRLRTLFLAGFVPILRLVAIPIRPLPGSAEMRQKLPAARFPSRYTTSNRLLEGPLPIESLVGNARSATCSPALKYIAPVSGAHPHAKSVRGLLVPLIGLVSSFHQRSSKICPLNIPVSGRGCRGGKGCWLFVVQYR